jgi:hypothetical protein
VHEGTKSCFHGKKEPEREAEHLSYQMPIIKIHELIQYVIFLCYLPKGTGSIPTVAIGLKKIKTQNLVT